MLTNLAFLKTTCEFGSGPLNFLDRKLESSFHKTLEARSRRNEAHLDLVYSNRHEYLPVNIYPLRFICCCVQEHLLYSFFTLWLLLWCNFPPSIDILCLNFSHRHTNVVFLWAHPICPTTSHFRSKTLTLPFKVILALLLNQFILFSIYHTLLSQKYLLLLSLVF